MYRWNQEPGTGSTHAPGRRGPARDGQPSHPGEATRAVQEALDRRDNGGDAAARRDR